MVEDQLGMLALYITDSAPSLRAEQSQYFVSLPPGLLHSARVQRGRSHTARDVKAGSGERRGDDPRDVLGPRPNDEEPYCLPIRAVAHPMRRAADGPGEDVRQSPYLGRGRAADAAERGNGEGSTVGQRSGQ